MRVHIGQQSLFEGYGEPECSWIRDLAKQAEAGEQVVAAPALDEVRFDFTKIKPPRGSIPLYALSGTVRPNVPATARRPRPPRLGALARLAVRHRGTADPRACGRP